MHDKTCLITMTRCREQSGPINSLTVYVSCVDCLTIETKFISPPQYITYAIFLDENKSHKQNYYDQYCELILSSSELSSFASRVWGGLQVAVGAKRDSTRTEERPKKSPPKLESEAGETSDKSLRILADFVEATAEKGVDGIIKEYRRLDNFFDPAASYEAFKNNMTKNRYSDVVCTDSTRVRLRFGGTEFGDYIHANHVVNPLLTTKFICTQGPLESTVDDFWRMIYQERVESILMLCKPAEDGRVKCHIYWPEDINKILEMPMLQVTNTGEDSEFNTLTLLVELSPKYELTEDCLPEPLRKPLIVKLFRWISWPDRGVPDETSCIIPLRLLDRCHSVIVLHCAVFPKATITFIAFYALLQSDATKLRHLFNNGDGSTFRNRRLSVALFHHIFLSMSPNLLGWFITNIIVILLSLYLLTIYSVLCFRYTRVDIWYLLYPQLVIVFRSFVKMAYIFECRHRKDLNEFAEELMEDENLTFNRYCEIMDEFGKTSDELQNGMSYGRMAHFMEVSEDVANRDAARQEREEADRRRRRWSLISIVGGGIFAVGAIIGSKVLLSR
uniref:Tyrosine-protein phosphatase domain-containing protein n=1 Tax=Heterorhabditis bacteriophora TaxID=37862 RepID=A0A1I7XKK8_HETBA